MAKANKRSKRKGSPSRADLEAAIVKCRKRYGSHPNVIGVGGGLKFVKGRPHKKLLSHKVLCVQFYVREKIKPNKLSDGMLPRYVYGRKKNGSKDRKTKILTDVIQLKALSFACESGTAVQTLANRGIFTLIFQNKGSDRSYYAVTCAHVAGAENIRRPPNLPRLYPDIKSDCCQDTTPGTLPIIARVVFNTTHDNERLEYDIAVAELLPSCIPQPELQVNRSGVAISRFRPINDIKVGMRLSLSYSFPGQPVRTALVSGWAPPLPIKLNDGRWYTVANLIMINMYVPDGSSGSLLYSGSDAVGILVARDTDPANPRDRNQYGFFQPISEAFRYLQRKIEDAGIKRRLVVFA